MMTPDRDKNGRFTLAPVGRPREVWRKELHNALRKRFPGERIADILEEAYDINKAQKSGKGLVGIAEFIRDTIDGLPVQRTETNDSSFFQQILSQLREEQKEDESTEIRRMMADNDEIGTHNL